MALDSDDALDPAVHLDRRQQDVPGKLGFFAPDERGDELRLSVARRSVLKRFADFPVLAKRPDEPGGVRLEMSRRRPEKMIVDFRERLEPLQVVLERARECATRKAREVEHGERCNPSEARPC